MTQGLAFVADMKLGHYLKLPPRTMFFGQLIATVWSCLVQVAVFYCKYRVYNAQGNSNIMLIAASAQGPSAPSTEYVLPTPSRALPVPMAKSFSQPRLSGA